ncbi:hypothetical protein D3C84_688750 [compost metagenome]
MVTEGIQTELGADVFGAVTQLHAELAGVIRFDIVGTVEGGNRTKIRYCGYHDALATTVKQIGRAEVTASGRDTGTFPLELVVAANRQRRGQLQLGRELLDRQGQLLELRVGYR